VDLAPDSQQPALQAKSPAPTAAATLHSWTLACLASTRGDNLIRVKGTLFALDHKPRQLANGALRGRCWKHTAHGFTDIGGFEIAADGSVNRCPAELADTLPGASRASKEIEAAA
jgi:hypothetical protein